GTVRLLVFNTHYRQPLDWSDESLAHAREGSRRLGETRDRLREQAGAGHPEDPGFVAAAETVRAASAEALNDDLNGPRALASLFVFAREANRLLDARLHPGPAALGVLYLADQVLDVMPSPGGRLTVGTDAPAADLTETPPGSPIDRDRWALAWANRRREAKLARDYAEADRIR